MCGLWRYCVPRSELFEELADSKLVLLTFSCILWIFGENRKILSPNNCYSCKRLTAPSFIFNVNREINPPFFSSILRTISHMPKTETWKFERVKAQSLHGEGYHVVNPENCDLKDMRFTFGDNKVNLPNPLIYHLFG